MTDRLKIQITNGDWLQMWTADNVPMQNDWVERLRVDRRLYSGRITERNFDMPSKTLTLHISGAYE